MTVTAVLGVTPRQGMIASMVTANAQGSSTTATRVVKAVFNWGDGSTPTTVDDLTVVTPVRGNQASPRTLVATHNYDPAKPLNAGGTPAKYWQYVVTVTVTDNTGASASTTKTIVLRQMQWDLTVTTGVTNLQSALSGAPAVGSDGLTGPRCLIQGPGHVYNCGGLPITPKQGMVIWGENTTANWNPSTGVVTIANAPILDGQFSLAGLGRGFDAGNGCTDVTIHGLLMRNYTNAMAGTGNLASNANDPNVEQPVIWGFNENGGGHYWLVEYCEVGPNRSSGIKLAGDYAVAQFCYVHDNDCEGLEGGAGYYATVQFCHVKQNNVRNFFNSDYVGGGGKATHCWGTVYRFNRTEANGNNGHWLDGFVAEVVWEDNWVLNNQKMGGLFSEIVDGTHVLPQGTPRWGVIARRNILIGNGINPVDGGRCANLLFSATRMCESYHNIIDGGSDAISFVTAVRPDGWDHLTLEHQIHDNWIRFQESGYTGRMGFYNGSWASGRQTTILAGGVNTIVIDYNSYFGTQAVAHFALFSPTTTLRSDSFASWQAGDVNNPGGYDDNSVWNQGTFPSAIPIVGGAPTPVPPTCSIDAVQNVSAHSATVKFTVTPGSASTTYTLTCKNGATIEDSISGTLAANAGPTALTWGLANLDPAVVYTLTLTATSTAGDASPFSRRLRRQRPKWVLLASQPVSPA